MKSNIALKLDAEVLRRIRTLAAAERLSVSPVLAAALNMIVRRRTG
jgi:predicted transcriptional regulator